MRKSNSTFIKTFSYLLCCAVCLNFLTIQKIEAFETSPQEKVLKTENAADESSKIWSNESYRRSIQLYLEVADVWTSLNEPAKSSECLRQAARLYFLLLDYEDAERQLLKAVKIDEKNDNPTGLAKSTSLLSLVFLEKGDSRQSESFYIQSVKASKISGDYSARAAALLSEAEYSYFHRDADTTVRLYEEALSCAEQSGDAELLAQILLNLSYAYSKRGEPVSALKTAKQSLAKWQEIKDERGQAVAYVAIGLAHKVLDEGQNALNAYYNAEALFPPDMDLIEQARLATGIASIYINYNVDNIAKNYFQKAYNLYEKAQYPMGQLAVLPFLIKLNYSTNNAALAEKYLEEVKLLSRKLDNERLMGYTSEVLGNEKLKNGLIDEAINHYSPALRIFQKYKDKKGMALLHQRLGEAFVKKEMYSEAIENFNHSLNINREIKDKFAEAENLYHLAKIEVSQGNEENSLNLIKSSIELTENLYSDVINTKLKSTYFSSSFDRYELYIKLLMKMRRQSQNEKYAIEALQAAEKSRARSMLETLTLSQADYNKEAKAETVKREKEIRVLLNVKADKMTNLLSQNAAQTETEKLNHEIHELENELQGIKGKLKQQSPVYAAIKNPAPFNVGEFQKQILDENTMLLEFSFGEEESYLWLIGKTEVSSFILPPREQIETKIQALRELLASREMKKNEEIETYQARIVKADNDYRQIAAQLSGDLLGQISDKIEKKRLIIVPDGKLHYFPVSALPLPNAESHEPILLANETIYEPSAQTLSILAKTPEQTSPAEKDLLVFSDPVFTNLDSRLSAANESTEAVARTETASKDDFRFVESLNSLSRLPASKAEADSIINVVGGSKSVNFSGFSANREQLLNSNVADYKIIHFATHGLVNEQRPELSGIVLSRFDGNGRNLEEIFRIQDIYGLNLNADLVVLSACSTGVGKEVRGEGLMSLNNAFLQTGAKSVLASLWKVEDNATLELMENFYAELAKETIPPSEALRRAQVKLRQKPQYNSPFYWAAFTVQGDVHNIPKISRGFGIIDGIGGGWFYLLLIVPLAALGVYLFRKRKNDEAKRRGI